MLAGSELTIIALIGVILLIGIVKKNAIMMTTLAALLGAAPMILDNGVGSEPRRPLGVSIAGGSIVSQALTLCTTPIVYLYFDRLRLWFGSAAWLTSFITNGRQ